MRKGVSTPIVMLLAAVLLVILLLLGFILLNRSTLPLVVLPKPNGYDTLYQAGNMVSGLPEDYADTSDREKLNAFVANNARALQLVEQAVDQEHLIPIDYEAGMQAVVDSTIPIRQALRLLHVNARIAELDGDKSGEAVLYAKLFSLSSKSANGGVFVHTLAAAAYEKHALEKLKEIAGELSAPEKNKVSALLASVERRPIDVNRVLERERVLLKREHGTIAGSFMIWQTSQMSQRATQQFVQTDNEITELYQEVLNLLRQ